MSSFAEYQMPEFAVVGATAFVRGPMSGDRLVEVTITKVLKRQVVVQWVGKDWNKGESTDVTREARFSVENWGKRLREVNSTKDKYRKDELISEENDRRIAANQAQAKARENVQSEAIVAARALTNPRGLTSAKIRETIALLEAAADSLEMLEQQ